MPAVLIVAHAPLATALKSVADHVYANCGHAVEALDVDPAATPEDVQAQALVLMTHGSERDWLVLTDVIGATPCNAALRLADPAHVRVVTGVNVPMLWRTLCYADESLDLLVTRAVSGASQGVMQLAPTRPQNQLPAALPRESGLDQDDPHHQQ
jgi:PTS system ascorbate-specific IIA component